MVTEVFSLIPGHVSPVELEHCSFAIMGK